MICPLRFLHTDNLLISYKDTIKIFSDRQGLKVSNYGFWFSFSQKSPGRFVIFSNERSKLGKRKSWSPGSGYTTQYKREAKWIPRVKESNELSVQLTQASESTQGGITLRRWTALMPMVFVCIWGHLHHGGRISHKCIENKQIKEKEKSFTSCVNILQWI